MNAVTLTQSEPHDQLQSFLHELHHSLRRDTAGVVASHLPELSQADPYWFGLCAMTYDGALLETGDSRVTFTVQSIAKPLILALALEDHDADTILHKIGVEPTGERFDSIVSSTDQATHKLNPFMNAGAIATLNLIGGHDLEECFERICGLLQRLLSKSIGMDHKTLASRRLNDHQNRAIVYLLLSKGLINGPVEPLLELYHRICCLSFISSLRLVKSST